MIYTLKQQQLLFDLRHYRDLKEELKETEENLCLCFAGSETYAAFSAQQTDLLARISEVERRVLKLPEQKRRVLVGRFFEGKTWFDVSQDVGYSVDHCSGKLLRRAFQCFLQ